MRDPRRALRPILALLALAGSVRAEDPPRLKAAWKEHATWSVVLAPGGRALVSSGRGGSRLRDAETGEVRAVLSTDTFWMERFRFSPDGRLVIAEVVAPEHRPLTLCNLRVWDAATGRVHGTIPYSFDYPGNTGHFALAPGGRMLAALDNAPRLPVRLASSELMFQGNHPVEVFNNANPGLPRVMLWDVPGWKPLAVLDAGSRLAFSPDGSMLATGSRGRRGTSTLLWDTATGELRAELDGDAAGGKPMAFSPDGRLLAICGWGEGWLWELAGRRRWAIPMTYGADRAPAFSPDGTLLFPNGLPDGNPWQNTSVAFLCYDVSTLPPRRINLGAGQHNIQPFTSNEPQLLIAPAAKRYAAFGAADASRRRRLTIHALPDRRVIARGEANGLGHAAFTADGRWLALSANVHEKRPDGPGSDDRMELRLIDPATAKVRATIAPTVPSCKDLRFSLAPDGRSLAVFYRTGDGKRGPSGEDPPDRPTIVEVWEIPPG